MTKESKETPEVGENSLEKIVSGLFISLGLGGGILEVTAQPYFQHLKKIGEITDVQNKILIHFLNHIGDVTNGFLFGSLAIVGDIFLKSLDIEEKKSFLLEIRKILPFIICTIMFAWITDAETIQLTKNIPLFKSIVGNPNSLDLPAGYFGLIAGAYLYEAYKKVGIAKAKK